MREFSDQGGDLWVIVGGVGEEEGGVPGGHAAIHFERGIVVEVAGTGEIGAPLRKGRGLVRGPKGSWLKMKRLAFWRMPLLRTLGLRAQGDVGRRKAWQALVMAS